VVAAVVVAEMVAIAKLRQHKQHQLPPPHLHLRRQRRHRRLPRWRLLKEMILLQWRLRNGHRS
jgi:hypothetical protein